MLKKFIRKLIIISCVMMFGLAMLSFFSPDAPVLGVTDGRLSPCPNSPNCVSSMTTKEGHAMAPIALSPAPEDASAPDAPSRQRSPLEKLQDVIAKNFPRATLTQQQNDYMRYEFRTLVFRFVDDVEFLWDQQQNLIHFRSSSRVGRSDLGLNRKRIEKIKDLMDQ